MNLSLFSPHIGSNLSYIDLIFFSMLIDIKSTEIILLYCAIILTIFPVKNAPSSQVNLACLQWRHLLFCTCEAYNKVIALTSKIIPVFFTFSKREFFSSIKYLGCFSLLLSKFPLSLSRPPHLNPSPFPSLSSFSPFLNV